MNLLQTILKDVQSAGHALTGHPATAPQQQHAQAPQAQAPDITYNPNPNTNIPNSTHDPAVARAMANPGLMKQLLTVVAPHLAANQPNLGINMQRIQGNIENPGATPLQDSGQGGMGYAANLQPANVRWQNTDGATRNMLNPQVDDNGYYYDN